MRRAIAVVAVVLAVAAATTGFTVYMESTEGPGIPVRPFMRAEKRTIEAELEAALAARRDGRLGEMWAHARRASALAVSRGQLLIAVHIAGLSAEGCFASSYELHIRAALLALRESPTVGATVTTSFEAAS